MNNLLHHLSEHTFRFYEPYLTLGVRNFPDETSWDIAALRASDPTIRIGPTTFVARLRDAYVSLLRFHWEPTTVDLIKLADMRGKFSFTLQTGTSIVWFKNKGIKGRPSHLMAEAHVERANTPSVPSAVLWKDATNEEVLAACLLLSNRRIAGPILIDRNLDSLNEIGALTSTLDIAMRWDEEHKQTVIT